MVNVPERVRVLLEELKGAGKERKALLEELAGLEAERLVREQGTGNREQEETLVMQVVFAGRDVEFCKRVVSRVVAGGFACVAGNVSGADGVIAAGRPAGAGVNVGQLLREVLTAAGARGGGSAEMAQGVCRGEQVEQLVANLGERLTGAG